MPKSTKKKKARLAASKTTDGSDDPTRPGMPAKENVREVVDLVSPQDVHYKILKTNETDEYDSAAEPADKRSQAQVEDKDLPTTAETTESTSPPVDDPLHRGLRESDLNTRELAEKRLQVLKTIRETSRPKGDQNPDRR